MHNKYELSQYNSPVFKIQMPFENLNVFAGTVV